MSTKLDEGIKALENVEVGKVTVVPTEPMTPVQMTQYAVQHGASPEDLLKYMELQERAEANEAKRAYHVAMNKFKANPPELHKNKTVRYENNDGSFTTYDHATLDNVTDVIGKALAEHGLSHRWDLEPLEGGQILVTCVITHVLGHSESVSLKAGLDQSGKKNNIQAAGSTVTYLQRYTLLSATGLAVKGMDNDGQTITEEPEAITEEQSRTVHALLTDNDLPVDLFMKYLKSGYKVDSIDDIPAEYYKRVIKKINTTIDEKRKSA